jgi:hypothetical protein
MSFLLAAQCVAPLPPAEAQALRAYQQRFSSATAVPLRLRYSVAGKTRQAPGTCQQIAREVGRNLHCDATRTGGAPAIELAAEVYSIEPRWQKNHQDEMKSVRYLSGQRTVDNPDYERARVEYELAERRFSEIEGPTLEAEARCRDSGLEADCNEYNSRVDLYNKRKSERDDAKFRFDNEPATRTEDVYQEHRYVTRTHKWISPFRASIQLGTQPPHPEIAQIEYTDSEQQGFAKAGVEQDPFVEPGDTYYRDESSRWLISRLRAYVKLELDRRAELAGQSCEGDTMECWARAHLWGGTTDFGLAILRELAALHRQEQLPAPSCQGR